MWWSPYSNFPSCPHHVLYGLWREEQGLLFLIQSSRILLRIIFCICSGLFSFFSCRSSLKPFAFLSSHWHIWRVQVSCFVEHSSIWAYLFPHVYIYIYFFMSENSSTFVFETLPTNRFVENIKLLYYIFKIFFRQRNIFSGISYPVALPPKIEFHSTQSALSHPLCGLEKEPEKPMSLWGKQAVSFERNLALR